MTDSATVQARHGRVVEGKAGFDQPGHRTLFDEFEVGREYPPVEWIITNELLDKQLVISGEYHEWYVHDSPWGGRIAPMWINWRSVRALTQDMYNLRGLAYHYECENFAPLQPGVKYRLNLRLADKWKARGRGYVKYEATCFDPQGHMVFRTFRTHAIDVVDDAGRARTSAEAEPWPMGDPIKRVDRNTPIGYELPPMSLDHSVGAMIAYELASFVPPRNIHTDQEAAEHEGLPAPIGTGPHFGSTVSRMMMAAFEEGWIEGGKISLKLIAPTFAAEVLTAKGIVREKTPEGDALRFICEVWIENQRGRKVAVGEASALVR